MKNADCFICKTQLKTTDKVYILTLGEIEEFAETSNLSVAIPVVGKIPWTMILHIHEECFALSAGSEFVAMMNGQWSSLSSAVTP